MTELVTSNQSVYDDGLLWSFLRDTMIRGTHIAADTKDKSYEHFSARLDAAALEQVDRLKQQLSRMSHVETTSTYSPHEVDIPVIYAWVCEQFGGHFPSVDELAVKFYQHCHRAVQETTSELAPIREALTCDGACRYDNYGRIDRDPSCSTHGRKR